MRKIEVLIVVAVVATAAAYWHRPTPPPGTQPKPGSQTGPQAGLQASPTPMTTRSGRWTVLPNRYQLATLSIGMSESQIVEKLGQPQLKDPQNGQTTRWEYHSDGAELRLSLLEGRLIAIDGSGRWALSEGEKPLPGFQSRPEQIVEAFGEPDEKTGSWVYHHRPGDLSLTFENDRVSQMIVTGEIAPQKLSP